eukprot:CAMPEP_0204486212 /NCGR_PEP_ID=MMETSP0471-20130131/63354_1 /ASSEMBLY_ACC=CAM_ASM_000602 /TAXON_ID=2969 /ORGANISM="Oxyrrhis marina" /LENGTH=53 /DNA_ID=CAMNT_0051489779 /DNA_START=105 /DNA_END=263 /DNA_ORIENTATION=-
MLSVKEHHLDIVGREEAPVIEGSVEPQIHHIPPVLVVLPVLVQEVLRGVEGQN